MKTLLPMYLCCIAMLFTACSDDKDVPGHEDENPPSASFVSEKDFNEIIVGKYWISTGEGGRCNAKGEIEALDVVGFNDIYAFYIDGPKFRKYGVYPEFYNIDIKLYDGKTGILYTVGNRHSPIHFEKIEDGKVRITYDYDKGMPRYDENGKMNWEEGSFILGIFRPATEAEIARLNRYAEQT